MRDSGSSVGRTELREIDRRHFRQRRARRRAAGGGTRRGRAAAEDVLDERLDVLVRDAALEAVAGDLGEVHAELAREPAHRGPGVRAREARLVDGREVLAVRGRHAQLRQRHELAAGALAPAARPRGGGAGAAGGGGAGRAAGAAPAAGGVAAARLQPRRGAAAAGAPAPSARSVASRSPLLSLPPLVAWIFSMTPLAVDGTSIVALSVSSVTSGVSTLDAVAGLHQHVDDGDVLEVAHVGHAHFHEARGGVHRRTPSDLPGHGLGGVDAERLDGIGRPWRDRRGRRRRAP